MKYISDLDEKIANSSTFYATPVILILICALTQISWGCSSTPAARPYLLLTWMEPVDWQTAAAKCQGKNAGSRLATLNPKRMDYIQAKIGWDNITTSGEFNNPIGIWRARASGDSDKLCPSISIKSGDEEGSDPVVTWNDMEDCKNLLAGIICEGSYTGGSVVTPVYCYARYCVVKFGV